VQSLHGLNSEAHGQNLKTGERPGDRGEQMWSSIGSAAAALERQSKWADSTAFDFSYGTLKETVVQYNNCIIRLNKGLREAKKAFQLQLLVVPEITTLEILGLRLYSGDLKS
jgi:hypothetical protein